MKFLNLERRIILNRKQRTATRENVKVMPQHSLLVSAMHCPIRDPWKSQHGFGLFIGKKPHPWCL